MATGTGDLDDEHARRDEMRRLRPSGKTTAVTTGDGRHDFERDVDRFLYAFYFRRLAEVTQVFSIDDRSVSVLHHNRMTHSLKVGQLGGRIAQHLMRDPNSAEGIATAGGLDATVVEAAGRAHDLGHPPFGHIGEEVLDKVARQNGLPDGFEGNAQTFRVIVSLGHHRPVSVAAGGAGVNVTSVAGMDLTAAVTAAAVKYPWARAESGKRWYKYGYYTPDKAAFDTIVKPLLPASKTKTLEASVMDWADDITYAVHDVEDMYLAGLLPLERLAYTSPRLSDEPVPLYPNELNEFWTYADRKLAQRERDTAEGAREKFAEYAGLFPRRPYDQSRLVEAAISALASKIISEALAATSVRPDGTLHVEPPVRSAIDVLKQLTWYFIIDRPDLAGKQQGQRKRLEELTRTFIEWASGQYAQSRREPWPDGANVPLTSAEQAARSLTLPVRLREFIDQLLRLQEAGRVKGYDRDKCIVRGVIDYVASLREPEVEMLHMRICR
jgi:dGTPase